MNPKISVIIPVYNVEPYLRQCLDSVVNQTYRNLEIIIVDDGSPDNCGRICDEYAKKDDRIRIIHKENAGVSAARNDGMRIASGEWTTFVDSDDWLDLDYYERMVSSMPQEKSDIFCAGGLVEDYLDKQKLKYVFDAPFLDRGEAVRTALEAKTLAQNCGTDRKSDSGTVAVCWNKFYRTGFLQENGFCFDVRLHPMEDILFHLNVYSKATAIAGCTCIGYHYRQNVSSSAMRRFNPSWPEMFYICVNSMADFVKAQPKSELLENAMYARVINLSVLLFRCYFCHPENTKSYRTISKEVVEYKKHTIVNTAIHQKSNRYLSWKQILFKYLLRLPAIWPIWMAFRSGLLRGIKKWLN